MSFLNKIYGHLLFFRSQLKNTRRLLLSPNPLALIEPILRSISFVAVKKKETVNFHPKKNSMRDYSDLCKWDMEFRFSTERSKKKIFQSTESKTKQKKNRKNTKTKLKCFLAGWSLHISKGWLAATKKNFKLVPVIQLWNSLRINDQFFFPTGHIRTLINNLSGSVRLKNAGMLFLLACLKVFICSLRLLTISAE